MNGQLEFEQATPEVARQLTDREAARHLTDRIKEAFAEAERLRRLRDAELLKAARALRAAKKGPDKRSVYFIQATDGLIKIGVAGSPEDRLRTLQTMSPVPLKLRLVLPGGGAQREAELHERFREHRSHGEWFRPASDLISFMNSSHSAVSGAPSPVPPTSRTAPRPAFVIGQDGKRYPSSRPRPARPHLPQLQTWWGYSKTKLVELRRDLADQGARIADVVESVDLLITAMDRHPECTTARDAWEADGHDIAEIDLGDSRAA